ncbi:MAG: hypothetical protein EOM88_04360, partial [Clostridia bacterium]|nr:hypothetical protein [Clostridia bacterium]
MIMILVLGLILQLFFVSSTSADFKAQAFATSNNLLLGKSASSITNFHYNIISLPGNSSIKVQFSQNNSTWYSAAGVSGAWETLTGTGVGDISLTSLAWSGASFYYKFQLNATSDQSQTPVIGDIRLDFEDEDSDQVFVFDNSGNVGIGLTNPSQKLDVAGKIALDGTTIAYLPTAFTGTLILGDGGTNLQTGADYNTFVGLGAGVNNTTGSNNTANGYQALYGNTTGSNNTANGYSAGRYIANGGANQTGSNSLFLGADTRAKANGETNQIVIGYGAIGNGSNTVTIGNSSILKHIFESGYVGIGTTSPAVKLHIVGGTGNVLNVNGGRITGLNDTPDADSEAVPLGFLQANYSSTTAMIAASLWSGAKNGNIW